VQPKSDDDQMMGRKDETANAKNNKMGRVGRPINASVDWNKFIKTYEKAPREELINDISGYLLQTQVGVGADVIKQYSDADSRESFIKTAAIQIMSTPEYQLC
jgi:hypothetical protein